MPRSPSRGKSPRHHHDDGKWKSPRRHGGGGGGGGGGGKGRSPWRDGTNKARSPLRKEATRLRSRKEHDDRKKGSRGSRQNRDDDSPRQRAPNSDMVTTDPVQRRSFFCGLIPREDVEMVVEEQGEFTVRKVAQQVDSSSYSQLCLSVRWNGAIHHVILRTSKNGKYALENGEFDTVDDLVKFYHESGEVLTEKSGAKLLVPLRKCDWLLRDAQLTPIQSLGEGNFGEVWKANFCKEKGQDEVGVAVKFLKHTGVPEVERKSFFSECRKLRQLGHRHIVGFIGVIVDTEPIKLVMELCDDSLLGVLKPGTVSWLHKTRFCLHVARGMEYLVECHILHRDLAARNCLIKENVVKIADLGMSEVGRAYKMEDGSKPIPLKWTCPNTIKTKVYTELSDVWSYGILMWEIMADGKPPYFEMQAKHAANFAEKLIQFLRDGNRLNPPPTTPKALQQLMMSCTKWDPAQRPTFQVVRETLDNIYTCMGGTISYHRSEEQRGVPCREK